MNRSLIASRLRIILLICLLLVAPPAVGAKSARGPLGEELSATAVWTFTCPAPGGWVSRPSVICVTVQDSDGLQEGTALYHYSTDGGASWSAFSSDGLVYSSPEPTTVYLTLTTSSLVDSATLNQVEFSILDLLGTDERSGARTIPVDGMPPTVTATPDKAGTWVQPPVHIILQATDALSGVDQTWYRRQGTMTWRSGGTITLDGSEGDGSYSYEYYAQDRAGTRSDTQVITVNVDNTAPGTPTNLFPTPPGWTNVNSFGLGWTNPTDVSGIGGAYYQLDVDPLVGGTPVLVLGDGIDHLADITVTSEARHTIYIWLRDRAGNSNPATRAMRSNAFNYDATPPVTMPSYTPPPVADWFSGTVLVSLVATDNASGVQETRWRRAGGVWNTGSSFSATETGSYEYDSADWAANREQTKSLTVQIDTVPPSSSIAVSPSLPLSGWYTGNVTITITAVDSSPGSGWLDDAYYKVDEGMWQQGSVAVISTNGTHSLTYYAVDRVGNRESPKTATNVCRIDRDPPTVTAVPSKTGTCLQPPVTVALLATDSLSGVAAVQYRQQGAVTWTTGTLITVTGVDGAYTYEYRAQDIAGNVSPVQTITVTIDGTPPGQPANLSVVPSGWSNVNSFRLCWTNPSDSCGIEGVYYQLDVDPIIGGVPIGPITGRNISCIPSVSVPSQGQHTIYLWLQDGAGNSDRYSREMLSNALKYDATTPYCDPVFIEGTVGEDPSWYAGCITITLSCNDTLSGVAAFYYQVEGQAGITVPVAGGPTTAHHTFSLCDCGRKTISYRVSDVAGNVQTASPVTVRVDREAPAAPIGATVSPSGWSNTNNFTVCWTNPTECSGVAAAYYKKGSPPTANDDGQLIALPLGAQPCISGITVGEGQTPVYIWLKDRVGLADYRTAISVTLRYDVTPPTTQMNSSGTLGRNGYYISPVTVSFAPSDGGSGVAETWYRVNNGGWQSWKGLNIALNTEGTYVVEFYSVDVASNREVTKSATLKLDLSAPTCTLHVDPDYLGRSFEGTRVCWDGTDTSTGSQVEKYTVQYRTGACGEWQNWLSDTADKCATRTGLTTNYFHYFRARAEDKAGHVSDWSLPGSDFAYVEGLDNPSFDTCGWSLWVPTPDDEGKLTTRVVEAPTRTGGSSCMALLSKPWPLNGVPADAYASFYQTIQLPPLECDRNQGLTLSFWYHILTYDKAWGKLPNGTFGWIDTFEVHILDRDGRELAEVLRDGYFGEQVIYTLYDLGWRYYSVDLTPWAGRQIRVEFKVWNRADKWYPTWVYVEDVKLLPSASHYHSASLPVVLNKMHVGVALGAELPQDAGGLVSSAESGYNSGNEPPKR